MGAPIRSVLISMWLAHLAGWRPRPLSGASPKARPGRCWRIRAQSPCTRRRASSSWGGYAPAAASSQGRSALLHRPRQLQLRLAWRPVTAQADCMCISCVNILSPASWWAAHTYSATAQPPVAWTGWRGGKEKVMMGWMRMARGRID